MTQSDNRQPVEARRVKVLAAGRTSAVARVGSLRALGFGSMLCALLVAGCSSEEPSPTSTDGNGADEPGGHQAGNAPDAGAPFFGSGDDPVWLSDLDEPDAGGDEEPTCGGSPFGAARVNANVLVIADKSGSMSDQPTGFDSDKWTVLSSALAGALEPLQADLSYGLGLFPFPDECSVPTEPNVAVGPGGETYATLSSTMTSASPNGGTPTAAALGRALEYFTIGAGATAEGDKYVLLATDGGPTCNAELSCGADRCVPNLEGRCPEVITNCCDPVEAGPDAQLGCLDDTATLSQVQALREAGILTFVVGIPGSELFADALNAFAVAGGAPNTEGETSYFAVEDAASLSAVLGSITQSLVTSCRLQLDSVPPDLQKLNVEVEDSFLPRDGADGWTLDESTTPPTVVLQGATCSRVESEGVSSVRVVYGCPTVSIQ